MRIGMNPSKTTPSGGFRNFFGTPTTTGSPSQHDAFRRIRGHSFPTDRADRKWRKIPWRGVSGAKPPSRAEPRNQPSPNGETGLLSRFLVPGGLIKRSFTGFHRQIGETNTVTLGDFGSRNGVLIIPPQLFWLKGSLQKLDPISRGPFNRKKKRKNKNFFG